MSKLSVSNNFGTRSSLKSIKTKESLISKKSRLSGSFISVHGSKFGRNVSRSPKQTEPGLAQTLSTVNSRVIPTIFNPYVKLNSELPDLSEVQATDCIRELGNSLNILDYEFNYASYWILDTLSKFIKDLQLDNFPLGAQHVALAWFRFVLRSISVSGASREDMFGILQGLFISASNIINEGNPIPMPEEVDFKDSDGISSNLSAKLSSLLSSKSLSKTSTARGPSSRRSLHKLSRGSRKTTRTVSQTSTASHSSGDKVTLNLELFCKIIEIIYNVFADRFVFTVVSLAYSSPTLVTPVDLHLDFHEPKQMRPVPVSPPPDSQLSPISSPKGRKKSTEKVKKKKSSVSVDEKEIKKTKSDKKKLEKSTKKPKLSTDIQSGKTDKVKESNQQDTQKKKSKKDSSKENEKSKSGINNNLKEALEVSVKEEKYNEIGDKGKGRKTSKSNKEKQEPNVKDIAGKKVKAGKDEKQNKLLKKDKKQRLSSLNEGKLEKGGKTERLLKKGKRSKASSLSINETDGRKIVSLEDRAKLFDRKLSPEVELEEERVRTKDQFLLPLSQAAGESYVENIFKAIIPQEIKPIEESGLIKEKNKEPKPSVEGGKKKQKDKKKK